MVPNLENFLQQDLDYYGQIVGAESSDSKVIEAGMTIIKQLEGVDTLIKSKKYENC